MSSGFRGRRRSAVAGLVGLAGVAAVGLGGGLRLAAPVAVAAASSTPTTSTAPVSCSPLLPLCATPSSPVSGAVCVPLVGGTCPTATPQPTPTATPTTASPPPSIDGVAPSIGAVCALPLVNGACPTSLPGTPGSNPSPGSGSGTISTSGAGLAPGAGGATTPGGAGIGGQGTALGSPASDAALAPPPQLGGVDVAPPSADVAQRVARALSAPAVEHAASLGPVDGLGLGGNPLVLWPALGALNLLALGGVVWAWRRHWSAAPAG